MGGVVSAFKRDLFQGGTTCCPLSHLHRIYRSPEQQRVPHRPLSLRKDEQNIWRMDFEDMGKKIAEQHIHAAIFCSPHNPAGRVWEKWRSRRPWNCFSDTTYVISDEIWFDLILKGTATSPPSLSARTRKPHRRPFTPSKTFNLAGLVGSYHIIYNRWLRDRSTRNPPCPTGQRYERASMHALTGAYKPEGYEWVDELRQVLT